MRNGPRGGGSFLFEGLQSVKVTYHLTGPLGLFEVNATRGATLNIKNFEGVINATPRKDQVS